MTAIVARLKADIELRPHLAGSVWDRPLVKHHGPLTVDRDRDQAATPEAFDPRTGALLSCAAVVTTSGIGQSFGGSVLSSSLGGVTLGAARTVTVWLYEQYPQHHRLEPAKARILYLLHRAAIPTDHEGQVVLSFVGDLGWSPNNYDDELDAYVDQVRFRAASMLGRMTG